jgi:hypothetical protein
MRNTGTYLGDLSFNTRYGVSYEFFHIYFTDFVITYIFKIMTENTFSIGSQIKGLKLVVVTKILLMLLLPLLLLE